MSPTPSVPKILVDPTPRTLAQICDAPTMAKLRRLGQLIIHENTPMPDAMIDQHLPDVMVLLGQTALPSARLQAAKKLRAIINVETNFTDNIDYEFCFSHGIHVLTPGAAFADAVAESALGMTIDLARGITKADRDFRRGTEAYGLQSNRESFHLFGQKVGLIGFGDLARSFLRLLAPFQCEVSVFDPWVPDYVITKQSCRPAGLDEILAGNRVILVFAGVTSENQGFIGQRQLALIPANAIFLLMSRAAVVDFEALVNCVAEGKFRAAIDVFPVEPVASHDPIRTVEGLLLSAHRTGGMQEALYDIGRQAVADVELILKGLPPMVCRRAQAETIRKSRSKPIALT
jgi:phosphoglycerate dehydrogenase-like enzyme